MLQLLNRIDRRVIYLVMLGALSWAVLAQVQFPEEKSERTQVVYDTIEKLPEGSRVLVSLDYDPASSGELAPMSAALVRHLCERKHKLYFMTLWERGGGMIRQNLKILKEEYPQMMEGRDYVNLGYRPGLQVAIRNAMSDMRSDFLTDARGVSLQDPAMPLTRGMKSFQELNLLVCIGGGDPGAKQWVQFAAAAYGKAMIAGSPGVQSPQLQPYIPNQLTGMLGNVKAAAEYEILLIKGFPQFESRTGSRDAQRRMGPQLVAHLLIVSLIALGNFIYFLERRAG